MTEAQRKITIELNQANKLMEELTQKFSKIFEMEIEASSKKIDEEVQKIFSSKIEESEKLLAKLEKENKEMSE